MTIARQILLMLRLQRHGEKFINSAKRELRRIVTRQIQIVEAVSGIPLEGNLVVGILEIYAISAFSRAPAVGKPLADRADLQACCRIFLIKNENAGLVDFSCTIAITRILSC